MKKAYTFEELEKHVKHAYIEGLKDYKELIAYYISNENEIKDFEYLYEVSNLSDAMKIKRTE